MNRNETLKMYADTVNEIKEAGLFKAEAAYVSPQGAYITMEDGEKLLNMCANNYLGLGNNKRLIEAAKRTYDEKGYGLASVRFICGTQDIHKTLENKILDFMAGDYDMLLCTTIIENGLDIPNANTIIINQAQNIGLSDLHQLRGRVGRSNRRAFCYLIVPPLVSITEDARRRLKAIESFSDLGSGFNIAMQDLDIRGAGNLLGAEQSGFITDMGFETYQKILAEAMEELGMETGVTTKGSEDNYVSDCTIETDQLALIPDSYIDLTAEKIRIYKELDSLTSEKELKQMSERLADRFGPVPEELSRLFDIVRIRQLGQKLGFEKIIIKNNVMIAFFISNPLSQYYRSNAFAKILENVTLYPLLFELKQNDNRLRVFVRNVESLSKAYEILKKL